MPIIPRFDCAHCKATGTCSNGLDSMACTHCNRKYAKAGGSSKGLVCSVCDGRGSVEPFTLKLQNRFVPLFSAVFVLLLLLIIAIAYFTDRKDLDKILGFAGTLIGSITGYYFGGKNVDVAVTGTKPKKDIRGPEN